MTFRLLDLPLELRLKIYAYVLSTEIRLDELPFERARRSHDQTHFGIIRANSQIYAETAPLLMQVVCMNISLYHPSSHGYGGVMTTRPRHLEGADRSGWCYNMFSKWKLSWLWSSDPSHSSKTGGFSREEQSSSDTESFSSDEESDSPYDFQGSLNPMIFPQIRNLVIKVPLTVVQHVLSDRNSAQYMTRVQRPMHHLVTFIRLVNQLDHLAINLELTIEHTVDTQPLSMHPSHSGGACHSDLMALADSRPTWKPMSYPPLT